jgi:hypothetical protein
MQYSDSRLGEERNKAPGGALRVISGLDCP